jgi:hypothetical protein
LPAAQKTLLVNISNYWLILTIVKMHDKARVRQGIEWHGTTKQGKERQDKPSQAKPSQAKSRPGKARRGRARKRKARKQEARYDITQHNMI